VLDCIFYVFIYYYSLARLAECMHSKAAFPSLVHLTCQTSVTCRYLRSHRNAHL